MRIVVTADDFGFDDDTVRATIACFDAGVLTSGSIMANMPATDAALAYARAHPEFSWGVHLTWVGDGIERPIRSDVPELVTAQGTFIPSNRGRVRGMLRRFDESAIERETAAQLARVTDAGIQLSHVDSHGHLHKFGSFRHALGRVLPRFGVTRVRSVQDVYLRRPLRSPTYWLGAYWRWQIARGFRTTDRFYMPSSGGDRAWAQAILDRVTTGTLEIGVHPGGSGWRAGEAEDVREFARAARDAGRELVGWREI